MLAARDDQGLDGGGGWIVVARRMGCRCQPLHVAGWYDCVLVAVGQQDRSPIAGDGSGCADARDHVAPRSDIDPGGQPGQRIGDEVGDGQSRQSEGLAGQPVWVRWTRCGHDGPDTRIGGGGQDRADSTHGVTGDRPGGDLGPAGQDPEGGQRVRPELAGTERQLLGRVGTVTADVEGQAVEPGGMEEAGHRQGPVPRRLPAVHEDDPRARLTAPGRDEPGGQLQPGRRDDE